MPDVGDRVRVPSTKVGQVERDGVVTEVVGRLLRIKWSTGEESTVVPGPGSLMVVGKARARASTTTGAGTQKAAALAKKSTKALTKKPTKRSTT